MVTYTAMYCNCFVLVITLITFSIFKAGIANAEYCNVIYKNCPIVDKNDRQSTMDTRWLHIILIQIRFIILLIGPLLC